jgi:hypothetical protein
MRRLRFKFLGILLVISMIAGNAHAWHGHHATASALLDHCQGEQHHGGAAHHHHDRQVIDSDCCCDCLGCTPATVPIPDLFSGPSEPIALVRYALNVPPLSQRTPLPDPDPPKRSSLS